MSEEKSLETGEMVSSASDARMVNNLMRHQYRVLTNEEKHQMVYLKDLGLEFVKYLHLVGKTPEMLGDKPAGQASRELSVAQTKIEEAVMWAVKHVTG